MGIKFYVQPHWESLLNIEVWSDAATQIFYSLGPAFGGLITLSSYNRFDNNCHKDAILISMANCSTSVFAGFVIFSIIGFMAHELNVEVNEVVASGPGLAFIAYPEAVTLLPLSPLWSFMFFAMLITLGLDSQFTMTETILTAIVDQWPELRSRKSMVVCISSLVGFALGLPLCAEGGIYMFTLIDWFSASWSILLLALFEVILLIYVYGYQRLLNNIEEMGIVLHPFSKFYWWLNWTFFTPLILIFITIMSWIQFTPCQYGNYIFPDWIQALGWIMASSSFVIVLSMGIFEYYRRNYILKKAITVSEMFYPLSQWNNSSKATANVELQHYTNEAFNEDRPKLDTAL